MIVIGSATGAPGATTTALAVAAWLDGAVLVEADPDGGVLALRYGLGLEPGMVTLGAASQSGTEGVLAHAQTLPGGTHVVVGPETAERATHLWRLAGPGLVRTLDSVADRTVIVDAGRLGPSSPALGVIDAAHAVAVVCRSVAEEVIAAADRVTLLGRDRTNVGLVLIGDRPYSATDIATQMDVPVFGTIAFDRRGAAALAGSSSSRALSRSALMRSARTLAESLAVPCVAESPTSMMAAPVGSNGHPA